MVSLLYSTHKLQPLDVIICKPLSSVYSGQVVAFMERCQGFTSMSKRDFYLMSMSVWNASFKEKTILKVSEAISFSSFEPEVILERFNTRQPIPGGSSNSNSSALDVSNWKKTEGLLGQVVKDRRDPRAQKLKRVRGIALKLLLNQLLKRELLRRLRVVKRPQVLQQAYHHLSHDTAEQSSFQ
jgi:hypothetical protein